MGGVGFGEGGRHCFSACNYLFGKTLFERRGGGFSLISVSRMESKGMFLWAVLACSPLSFGSTYYSIERSKRQEQVLSNAAPVYFFSIFCHTYRSFKISWAFCLACALTLRSSILQRRQSRSSSQTFGSWPDTNNYISKAWRYRLS